MRASIYWNMIMIKVCSDFSGIGAFDCALKRLGIPHRNLYGCDIDKFVKKAYHINHEPENWYTNVYHRPIPTEPVDIYMTSPPCQAFSIAGKRQGEKDDRGVLFWNSLDFIRNNKPKTFIFENVKGLMSVENGAVFKTWIDHLGGGFVNGVDNTLLASPDAVPYDIWHFVLNSKNFGIAQSRERVFIVGIRQDLNANFVVPKATDTTKRLRDFLQPTEQVNKKYFLSDCRLKGLEKAQKFNNDNNFCFKFNPKTENDISNVILARNPNTSVDGPFIDVSNERKEYLKHLIVDIIKNPIPEWEQHTGNTWDNMTDADIEIWIENAENYIMENDLIICCGGGGLQPKTYEAGQIRKITPLECWRLQGFTDTEFNNVASIPMSDTQLYKQAGNSITVNVLAEIIKGILPTLEKKKT